MAITENNLIRDIAHRLRMTYIYRTLKSNTAGLLQQLPYAHRDNTKASAKGLPVAHFKKTAPFEQGFNGRQDVYILGDTQEPPIFFGGLG